MKIKNVENDDPAKDVVVSVKVKGGELKGPGSQTIVQIPASKEVVIDGVWTIEKGTDKTEILIEVKGRFVQTPDSGSAVLERHLQLKKPEKPPAEKPKPDTKEKPTTSDPKKPGEKPPAEKPPAEIIPATISQPGETGFADAGALKAGAWLLQGQSDQIQKKSDVVDGRGAKLNVHTLTVSGQTIESGRQWYGDARPRSMRSTLSLPNFPARVVMDQPTDLRLQLSRKTDGIFDDAIVTIFRQEGSPNLMMRLSGADIQTDNYNGLAFDLFSSFMYRMPAAGEVQSVKVKFVGPGGQFMRTYSYAWQPGGAKASAAPPSAAITPLAVIIASDKPTVIPGETALLKATATGGKPPFTYAWTGPVKGAADILSFTADKPGTQAFTVTVSDSTGATATAMASVKTEGLSATIRRTSTGPIILGQSIGFQAQLSAAGQPATGAFVYRWQPHPEVTYAPFEDAGTQTTAVFTRLGRTRVWVEVLRKEGPVLATVAESEQIEIDVVGPQLSLTANPSSPYPGQEVRLNVTMSPAILDKYVTFWWEIQGNALNAAPVVRGDAYSRAYTYKPKDTAPVTVTVHGKAKDGGDDLGQKSISVTARPYEVKIGEPRLMGPPPRVWSEQAKGLVEVPRAIGTFQDFYVKASVSPPPPDPSLRYQWTSQPEGC
ncbi:MAG: hypothetical protein NTU60_06230, partial [Candidatus Aminicenantes bacterium]|nr:hypothetical protein [Candidatus Aminicenantes bacterium]